MPIRPSMQLMQSKLAKPDNRRHLSAHAEKATTGAFCSTTGLMGNQNMMNDFYRLPPAESCWPDSTAIAGTSTGAGLCCRVLLTILLFPITPAGLAQYNYASFELQRGDNNWEPLLLEDLDGNGTKDIVVSHYDPDIGRELHIYHQQADGHFDASPQRVEIKTEIIAVGFADLRTEPGAELVLYANNGVFSLSSAIEGYVDNLKLLAEWDLIATIPEQRRVQFANLTMDVNRDGQIDLVLPGADGFGLFLGRGDERFEQVITLPTLNQDITPIQRTRTNADVGADIEINAEQGVLIEVSLEVPTPFEGFVEVWEHQATLEKPLLESENWIPAVTLLHLNQDQLLDLIYVNAGKDGLGQVNIHLQNPQTLFRPLADWNGVLDSQAELKLIDMNEDDMTDLLSLSGEGDNWEVRFYLNQGGSFNFAAPDQVMRLSGYEMDLEVINLEPGETVLSVSYYTVPVVDAIRNASIERTQLIYSRLREPDADGVFERRPDSRLLERFSAGNVRGLSEQMALQYDLNGDGRNDALYVTANGTLAAKAIKPDLQIASDPFWEYVSPRTVFEFEVMQLNNDDLPDLLLRHGNTTSLLVARP